MRTCREATRAAVCRATQLARRSLVLAQRSRVTEISDMSHRLPARVPLRSRALAIIVTSVAVACAPDARQGAPNDTASQATPATDLELRRDGEGRPIASADSGLDSAAAVVRLAELQRIADSARSEAVAAPALLRVGLLKLRLYPADIDGAVAAKRPQDFFHNEIAGGWLYNGADFDTLLARYPTSTLAEDARYAKIFLIPGGECEGFVECYIGFGLRPHFEFLRTDPSSTHAADVVALINAEIRRALAEVPDLAKQTESYDPVAVRKHIAAYDSIARGLPSPARESARQLLDSLLSRF
jgi:hypothetical protein